jgi:hypothetical protein
MPFCEHLTLNLNDINRCESNVDLCNNILECSCCCYFLEKHKQDFVDTLLNQIHQMPKEITRVKIPLLPLPANIPYYSFNGIETIIYNLFRTNNNAHIKNLKKNSPYLKVYYEKNPLFNLPIIQIELIFFGRLKDKTIDELWKTLKAEVLFFTGSVGDIDIISVSGKNHLSEILKIPLLVGYPEFKHHGLLLDSNFTPSQIKEMNYLHSFTLLPLLMSAIINNNTLELFDIQKSAIQRNDSPQNSFEEETNVDDVIKGIFEKVDNEDYQYFPDYEDLNGELPF